VSTAILDRYVGQYHYAATGQTVTLRRDADRLFMKISGNAPEGSMAAQSETRFAGPFGLLIEFQVDSQGKVTGAMMEQGPYRLPLARQ